MLTLRPSGAECASQRLGPDRLQEAVAAIRNDGFVVLEDVVAPGHVEILRDRMLDDVDKFVSRPDAPYNWNRGNVQQDPPPFPPYLFRDVLSNEFAIQVTRAILGQGLYNAYYSGNTAMPSEERQPVHADIGQLWPNLENPTPPYALVVNLPMVDMGPENGSTEIWPGTHTDPTVVVTDGEIKLPVERLESRRAAVPPLQPRVKAGSILIRDIRLWHAGMPNRTDTPRPMVAMIHYVGWWNAPRVRFAAEAQELLEHPVLRHHAEYVNGMVDYVNAPSGFEYAGAGTG